MVPRELNDSSILGVGKMQLADLSLVGAGCVCTRGYVLAHMPAPRCLGWGVCHHSLGPPSGPCQG